MYNEKALNLLENVDQLLKDWEDQYKNYIRRTENITDEQEIDNMFVDKSNSLMEEWCHREKHGKFSQFSSFIEVINDQMQQYKKLNSENQESTII